MDTSIEEICGKIVSLCRDHSEEFREILEDISLTDDRKFMSEWAHDNLKPEVANKWDE